jgi:VWFA-related protein
MLISLNSVIIMLRRRSLPASLVLFQILYAQDATFTSDVKVVSLLASVLEKNGAIVRTLGKDDFTVTENGKPQTITYFSRETDLPLTIGLMVDTSMSQRKVMEVERAASFRFLDEVLRETKDQVFVMQFDMSVQMRQPLTSSRKKLEESLSLVDTPPMSELRAQGNAGGTLLYDALIEAANKTMKPLHGRKALIVLSDGDDNGSENGIGAAIDAAQKADTLIYSILYSDVGSHGGRAGMSRMARETGGGYFEVSKKLGIDQIYAVIQDELRSQYNLGYVSDEPVHISEFRKIALTTHQKGLIVQARDRYWAQR